LLSVRRIHQTGMTLMEVLIAVLIAAIMFVAAMSSVVYANRAEVSNAQSARAVALAEEIFEQLIASPFDSVVYGGDLPVSSPLLPSGQLPADSSYQSFTTDTGLGLNPAWSISIADPDAYHRVVTLTIRWQETTGRTRQKVFRLYRYDDSIVAYPYRPAGAN
jgi:prepilin-type N-terminal cleavage/methylation domain-containing protein